MKNIDKKDERLLLELYNNGRASITEMASKIGLSKEATNYRLKRLQNEGILLKIVPIIDFSALGYSTYRIQVLLNPEGKKKKAEIEEELKKLKILSWLVKLSGAWDYVFLFNSRSNLEFSKTYEEFIIKFGKYIDKKISSLVFSITHFPLTYLYGGERNYLKQEMKTKNFSLDENQKKIIELLEEDGRITLLEMARRMDVSLTTVKYHLQILEKKRIIFSYKPLINLDKFNYEHFKVMIELADTSQKKILKEVLTNNPHTVYITDAWGKYDLEFECHYKSIHDLLRYIEKLEESIYIKKYDLIFTNEELLINGMPDE
ncbi:Lrp/AsnC family transcriptional regulator [Candidatus Woesearchaeota archaeon]|nr:Lrp/AsnC family transcriptional regulator [Candidatus Woesearchaeota archaeon]